jgi:hypothetical protein
MRKSKASLIKRMVRKRVMMIRSTTMRRSMMKKRTSRLSNPTKRMVCCKRVTKSSILSRAKKMQMAVRKK